MMNYNSVNISQSDYEPRLLTLHELKRKEELRLINLENKEKANKILNIRGVKDLNKKIMDAEYKRHSRAKSLMCKFPIVNMSSRNKSLRLEEFSTISR